MDEPPKNDLPIDKEIVDIGREAGDLEVFTSGSLEHLERKKELEDRWFRQKIITWLSVGIISVLLSTSIYFLTMSDDPKKLEWGEQIATTLLGFAAGAIWKSTT